MLIIFNMDWKQFDIDTIVAQANRKVNRIAADKGADHFVMYNTASLGAGEFITDHARRLAAARARDPDFDEKALQKGLTAADLEQLSNSPAPRTMDYLRRRHSRIVRDISNSDDFKAYRDSAEMLASLKKGGHVLAAVFPGATQDVERDLKRARCLDYFNDAVYGYDRMKQGEADLTGRALYLTAMRDARIPPVDSIVVTDTPEGVEAAQPVHPRVIAAYLTPYRNPDLIDTRLKEIKHVGAHYVFCGGHHIAGLPNFLFGSRQLASTLDKVKARLGGFSGPAPV